MIEFVKKHGALLAGVGLVIIIVYFFLESNSSSSNAQNSADAQLASELQQQQEQAALSQLTGSGSSLTGASAPSASYSQAPATQASVQPTTPSTFTPVSLNQGTGSSANAVTLAEILALFGANSSSNPVLNPVGPTTNTGTGGTNNSNGTVTGSGTEGGTTPPATTSPYGNSDQSHAGASSAAGIAGGITSISTKLSSGQIGRGGIASQNQVITGIKQGQTSSPTGVSPVPVTKPDATLSNVGFASI